MSRLTNCLGTKNTDLGSPAFEDLWVKEPLWASTSNVTFGRKGSTTLVYGSSPKYESRKSSTPIDVARGALREASPFYGMSQFGAPGKFGGFGPFVEARHAANLVHPDIVFDLLLESERMPRDFFLSRDQAPGAEPLKVVHAICEHEGLAEGQIAVCSGVTVKRAGERRPSRVMVFDPDKLPMPVRIEISGQSLNKAWDIDWREFAGGGGEKIWFPIRIRQEEYSSLPGKTKGKLIRVATANVDVGRTRVNDLVTDDDLTFAFPVDTLVLDDKKNERYVVTGSGIDPELHLTELLNKAAIQPSANNHGFTFISVAVEILLLLIVVHLVRVGYRHRAAKTAGSAKSQKN